MLDSLTLAKRHGLVERRGERTEPEGEQTHHHPSLLSLATHTPLLAVLSSPPVSRCPPPRGFGYIGAAAVDDSACVDRWRVYLLSLSFRHPFRFPLQPCLPCQAGFESLLV